MLRKPSLLNVGSFIIYTSLWIGIFWHLQAAWHQHLFGDEIHSLFFMENNGFATLLTKPIEPIHPNLSYLVFKTVYSLFPQVLVLRLLMFVVFIGSCYVFWLILDHFFKDKKTAKLLGLSLWINSAYIWHFSLQLRMYGFAFLLVLLSILALLKNKKIVSLFCDLGLLSFAYGGALFIVAKWLAYLLALVIKRKRIKDFIKQVKQSLLCLLLISLPLFSIFYNYKNQENIIKNAYLYWVKVPVFQDWSLGLAAFSSGFFLSYFESAKGLLQRYLHLATIANCISILILTIALTLFCYFYKTIHTYVKQKISINELFVILLTLIVLIGYTAIFIHAITFGNNIFHIRQLFSVAVIILIFLAFILGKIWLKKPLLAQLLAIIFIIVNQSTIIQSSLDNRQAYVHHFEQIPGQPILASVTDIELIYKQCHTFNKSEVINKCQKQNIYFSQQQLNLPEIWWQTAGFGDHLENISINCLRTSVDFYQCQKTDYYKSNN